MTTPSENLRQFFRLSYPEHNMPLISIDGGSYAVCEISEQGMRIICSHNDVLRIGDDFGGVVFFQDGTKLPVAGEIIRREGDHCIALLREGLTLECVVKEQRTLLRRV